MQRNIKNYENALIKQEKYVNILKSRISKLEKQILKKEEEIMSKDNTIFELSDQVNELTHKIQNMKEMNKLEIEQGIEIHQLVYGVLCHLSNLVILPYEATMLKVF